MGDFLGSVDLGVGVKPVSVTAGFAGTCAILDSGAVKCWGDNAAGQLGVGDKLDRGDNAGEMGANLASVDLGAGVKATKVVAASASYCALLDNRTVKCWGENNFGQLGLGDILDRGDAPGEMGANLPAVILR